MHIVTSNSYVYVFALACIALKSAQTVKPIIEFVFHIFMHLLQKVFFELAKCYGLARWYRLRAGLKVGHMTWTIWVSFLVGQVGLIRKLNYLDVGHKSVICGSHSDCSVGQPKCDPPSTLQCIAPTPM